jgi:LCP family protein required for cell wall assembly
LVLGLIILCALASTYLSLVIVTQVEHIFLPGNPLSVPGGARIAQVLPGINLSGDTSNEPRINILIVGIDRRPSDGSMLTRTDTIEIATIDPKTKSASIVGVPRDLWVDIPNKAGTSTFQDRVNTPLVYAETEHYSQGPIALEKTVIENNFHVTIDHYVVIDFTGFEKIIDALGGVDVNVPTEVADPTYSASELPGQYDPQHFYPGVQHMNGATALAYSRIRYNSDDFDRIQRQQRVIFAVISKAESLDALTNAPALWQQYKHAIDTDISDFQIPGYALLAKQVESNIRALSLAAYTAPYTTPEGADVLIGNWPKIREVMNDVFTDRPATVVAAVTGPTEPATP